MAKAETDAIEHLKKGAEAWRAWRASHPGEIDLSGADLSRCDLMGCNLEGAKFLRANLSGANLTKAIMAHSDLSHANLQNATLSGANLDRAVFEDADLTNADLSVAPLIQEATELAEHYDTTSRYHGGEGVRPDTFHGMVTRDEATSLKDAVLCGATLKGTKLGWADLRNADFRDVKGLYFVDGNYIDGTRFSVGSTDAWSVLRRAYTGPMLLFHLVLLGAFIVPYIATAAFWIVLGKTESAAANVQAPLRNSLAEPLKHVQEGMVKAEQQLGDASHVLQNAETKIDAISAKHTLLGEDLSALSGAMKQEREQLDQIRQSIIQVREQVPERTDAMLRKLQPTVENGWRPRYVLTLVLGIEESWLAVSLSTILLTYNLFRGIITYRVAPLRDEEDRTRTTPFASSYRRLSFAHRWFMWWVPLLAVILFALHLYHWLATIVMLPPA